ncbi:cyclohexanecarboxyl-CoA dehydrogenase [Antricoccus suffuscus]|uniref:Cyclohexanecarboxyl-CoA dehydrogenase n=1 Tax=Antricoccus suffuscus TaxID=1629062 RepID=A0A2T1A5S7_9ACTN|nr:acyl-CoA dehydrogenase family protein [Antricoccus suffuscus]PRZ43951.1 cyclohexanecarboxyl-CoA dehydrogenase [Antricoccus suffuscus]
MNDTAELSDFRATVRALARKAFLDGYLERAKGGSYPRDTLKVLGDNGLLGVCLPEQHGGQGAGLRALGIACEEVAYADSACAYQVFASNVAAELFLTTGSPEVIDDWLASTVEGRAVCAIALTEPGSGSDAQRLTAKAVPVDGGWELSGEKTSITQAPDADVAIVVARESDSGRISAFVMPMDAPGISRQRFDDPGFRAVGRGSIMMDRVLVPGSHRLGEGGRGFALIMQEFDLTRTLIAYMTLGIAQRAIDLTIEHVRNRTSFGKPLSHYQGVTFPIAEHLTHLAAVRALADSTLDARSAGRPHTVEAAMLKWWAPQVGFKAVQECVVLHGHIGWSEEMPLQALLRDVSGFQIGDGTPQIQKLIIARAAIGPEVMDR